MSGAKRRDIKKKWKARTFLERGSESSEDNVKETSETKTEEEFVYTLNVDSPMRARYFIC